MAGRIVINDAALRSLLTGPNGPVVRKIADVSRQVKNEAQRRCPVDEGRLRASITDTVTVEGDLVIGRIGTNVSYARDVHNGTGLYGPAGALIRPVNAKALRFKPKGGAVGKNGKPLKGGVVFAKWSRGSRPNPFLVDAMRAVVPWPLRVRYSMGGPRNG